MDVYDPKSKSPRSFCGVNKIFRLKVLDPLILNLYDHFNENKWSLNWKYTIKGTVENDRILSVNDRILSVLILYFSRIVYSTWSYKKLFLFLSFHGNKFESRLCVSSTARCARSRTGGCIVTDTTLSWICIWKLTSISSIHLSISHCGYITTRCSRAGRTCVTARRVGAVVSGIVIRAVPSVTGRVNPSVNSVINIQIEGILGPTFAK